MQYSRDTWMISFLLTKMLVIQADIFQKISREFIQHMLLSSGFPPKLSSLIIIDGNKYIATPSSLIIIDGIPCGFISSNRGLIQGDPLSPCLFAIAMECPSIMFELEHLQGNISPIHKFEPIIDHLFYADNLLVFSEARWENAKTIKNIIHQLEQYAGLKMDKGKSKL